MRIGKIAWSLILGATAATHLGASAEADMIPLCGAICFHSSDPTLVDVTLVHELQPARQVHLKVPRSAIIYVDGYKPSEYTALPDQIVTRGATLDLAIVAPDGKPLGEAVEDYAVRKGVGLNVAITDLRPLYAQLDVRVIGAGISTDRLYSSWIPKESDGVRIKSLPEFDGLRAETTEFNALLSDGSRAVTLSEGQYVVYFPQNDSDLFTLARCENKPHPVHWCEYKLRLSDLISLEVNMVDFRVHGGRQFIRDRMRMIVQAYCSYDPTCQN